MSRFYIALWFRWSARLTVCSLFFAILFSFFATLFIYFLRGMAEISADVSLALFEIFKFWFSVFWSLGILLALFRGLKYIFNNCISGFELKLLACDGNETIESIGYGDLIKVWRKWFMLLIWLVGSFTVLAAVFTNIFALDGGLFGWFDIYALYGFILLGGYISFIIMSSKCKRVKIVTC